MSRRSRNASPKIDAKNTPIKVASRPATPAVPTNADSQSLEEFARQFLM